MGELKQISEQQQTLVERVKALGQQIYLANLGLATKVEEEGKKQYDKVIAKGSEVRGAEASKAALAAAGLVEVLKAEAEKLKTEAEKLKGDGLKQQVESLKQRLTGLNLKEESQRLFDELVAVGEKRKAA
ncbi:MAG: phasin family protein [Pseudomonadota bacterium]